MYDLLLLLISTKQGEHLKRNSLEDLKSVYEDENLALTGLDVHYFSLSKRLYEIVKRIS